MGDVKKASADAAELVQLLGMPSAYELVKRYSGGPRIYIPLRSTVQHRIALVLGFVAAQKLSDRYGGSILKLPADRALVMSERNVKITKLVEGGQSFSVVGRMFGLSRQQVKNISVGDSAGKRNK
jgi:hypothetical protein